MDKYREKLGLSDARFKETGVVYVKKAEDIAEVVMTSEVVREFRKVAKHFLLLYKVCVGPSGFSTDLDIDTVRSCYSSYLQDFESVIKSQFALNLTEAFPSTEICIDLHNGITVIVPVYLWLKNLL
jgi:hypothetical protein